MSIDYQVFSDVSNVVLGGTAVEGVRSISLTRKSRELHASGDDDVYQSVARAGVCSLAGSILLPDVAKAHSIAGLSGTLSFVWRDGRAQADKTVTITGVSIIAIDLTGSHQTQSDARLTFVAESGDGTTDPITVT